MSTRRKLYDIYIWFKSLFSSDAVPSNTLLLPASNDSIATIESINENKLMSASQELREYIKGVAKDPNGIDGVIIFDQHGNDVSQTGGFSGAFGTINVDDMSELSSESFILGRAAAKKCLQKPETYGEFLGVKPIENNTSAITAFPFYDTEWKPVFVIMYFGYFAGEGNMNNLGRHNRQLKEKTAKILALYQAAFFESDKVTLPDLIKY